MEIGMDADEWRKKREALIGQLRDLEAGRISHWDEGDTRELNRETTEESIERVKQRLANLDAKFQDESGSQNRGRLWHGAEADPNSSQRHRRHAQYQ
jgi:hypothetical protein